MHILVLFCSETELDIFEAVDKKRKEDELVLYCVFRFFISRAIAF